VPKIRRVCVTDVIAAYRFVDLSDLPALRQRLLDTASQGGLKGTVLLAQEGINFNLAGEPAAATAWLAALQADARFAALELKRHRAAAAPFRRLFVKIKREIIRMNRPGAKDCGVLPAAGRAPAIDAATLARWLQQGRCDEGRQVVMLDTRNVFEVDAGAFEGALDWRIHKFSDFPQALDEHRSELKGKTVVSYCTGGIRCEKAALWMQQQGLPHVLQLDGGILRYFEDAPGAPGWQGRCVVFDERQSLDTALQGQPAEVNAG
jgi:UPF0176 protein